MSVTDILPGIFEHTWEAIEEKISLVLPYTEWIHIDVADNTLVSDETVRDFTTFLAYTGSTERRTFLEAHLMVADPVKYIRPLVDAGFTRLIAHVEANDPRHFLDEAHYESVEVGLAIDGSTEFEHIEPYLEAIDLVLVMTIEAGYTGQKFLPETLEKMKSIHEYLPDLPIEAEGGINEKTGRLAKDAGATRLVSRSFLFDQGADVQSRIERLKNIFR